MKLLASLTVLAVAALAGCAHEDRVIPAPAPVVVNPPASTVVVPPQSSATVPGTVVVAPAPAPLQPGYGRVDTIVPVPAAAAGATVPPATKRVGIRMDNGIVQYLDTTATGLSIGDRVEITADGMMRRP
ncbi:MAG TPA: hypothetical protein VE935_17775 [Burkholderiales bacterium]|jgi:hypothetical protein|nr:hypothetical protein [Burkholderiales bacterium]